MTLQERSRDLDAVFLREVVESPRDDTPLLIYADWLMDQPDRASQTRGEYLRLCSQLAIGKNERQQDDVRWQSQQLWWSNVENWLGPLYPAIDHFLYERGQLCIEISARNFMRHAEEAAECPAWSWITDVVVRRGDLDFLLYLGQLPRPSLLQSLDIGRRTLEEGELDYLLEQGFWDAPRELSLRHNLLGLADIRALANWPGLVGVRQLDLEGITLSPLGVSALVESPYFSAMEDVVLESSGLALEVISTLEEMKSPRVQGRYSIMYQNDIW